jgi:hypothetical protein
MVNKSYGPDTTWFFDTDSDAQNLVRRDLANVANVPGPDDLKAWNKLLSDNCGLYATVANVWCLHLRDHIGYQYAANLARDIQDLGLSRVAALLTGEAESIIRGDRATTPWVDRACREYGLDAVYPLLLFPKRFTPNASLRIDTTAIASFAALQRDVGCSVPESQADAEEGSTARVSRLFGPEYDRAVSDIKQIIAEMIGTGPDEQYTVSRDLGLVRLSPGASLLHPKCPSSKSQVMKLAHIQRIGDTAKNLDIAVLRPLASVKRTRVSEYWEVTGFDSDDVLAVEVVPPEFEYEYAVNRILTLQKVLYLCGGVIGDDVHQSVTVSKVCGSPARLEARLNYFLRRGSQKPIAVPGIHVVCVQCEETVWPVRELVVDVQEHAVYAVEVPKQYNKRRLITLESPSRMSRQLLLKEALERALKHSGYDAIIAARRQGQNRFLCAIGARTGLYATVDQSSASDYLTRTLMEDLLPDGWRRELSSARPTWFLSDVGCEGRLETYKPMGNGDTFWILSIVTAACAIYSKRLVMSWNLTLEDNPGPYGVPTFEEEMAAQGYSHVLMRRRARGAKWGWTPSFMASFSDKLECDPAVPARWDPSVVGDDAIVPYWYVDTFIDVLQHLGFHVNETKTFTNREMITTPYGQLRFRESCGGEYACISENGDSEPELHCVTPLYLTRGGLFGCTYDVDKKTYAFTDQLTTDWDPVRCERVTTTQLAKYIDMQHKLYDQSLSAATWLSSFLRLLVPDLTAHVAGTECSDLWASCDEPIHLVFDVEKPLVAGEPGITYVKLEGHEHLVHSVVDPVTHEEVVVNVRDGYLTCSTTVSKDSSVLGKVPKLGMTEGDAKTVVDDYLYEAFFLNHGHVYTCDTDIPGAVSGDMGVDDLNVPILTAPNKEAYTHVTAVEWTLRP